MDIKTAKLDEIQKYLEGITYADFKSTILGNSNISIIDEICNILTKDITYDIDVNVKSIDNIGMCDFFKGLRYEIDYNNYIDNPKTDNPDMVATASDIEGIYKYPDMIKIYLTKSIAKNNYYAMTYLANIYEDEQNYDLAKKYLSDAIKYNYSDAMIDMAYIYRYVDNDFANSEKYYKMAIEHGSLTADAYLACQYLNHNHDDELAMKHILIAIEKDENNYYAYKIMADMYSRNNDIKNAEKYYIKALEINPNSEFASYALGTLYQEKGDIPQAIIYFTKAAENGNDEGYLSLGGIYNNEDLPEYLDIEKTKQYYTKAAENGDYYAYDFLGSLCENEGNIDQAIVYYLKAIEGNDGQLSAMLSLGNIYKDMNNFDLCNKYLMMALEYQENEELPTVFTNIHIAESYKNNNNMDIANQYYRNAFDEYNTLVENNEEYFDNHDEEDMDIINNMIQYVKSLDIAPDVITQHCHAST